MDFSTFVGIIASLTTIGGAVAIAYIFFRNERHKKERGILLTVVISILIVVLFGVLLSHVGTNSHSVNSTAMTSSQLPLSTDTPFLSPTNTSIPEATSTEVPSPTTSQKTYKENLNIPYTGPSNYGTPYPKLALFLNDIIVDNAQSSTIFEFTVTNNGDLNCANIGFGGNGLELSDVNGNNFFAQDGVAVNGFSVVIGSSVHVNAVINNLTPPPHSTYSLSTTMGIDGCTHQGIAGGNNYQTESISF
jgi:hypothetical protein